MILTLTRDIADREATLGLLLVAAYLKLDTLELPWISDPQCVGGHPEKSCVPAGTYDLALHDSAEHPKSFALVNRELGVYHMPADVPSGVIARTCVLLHAANWTSQLAGCCAVGRFRRYVAERWMLAQSDDAYAALRSAVPWIEGHKVVISYAPGITP